MQKLVTIYLDSYSFTDKKVTQSLRDQHGMVEEHLGEYLNDGWIVKEISSFGGAAAAYCTTGFAIVVLEKG